MKRWPITGLPAPLVPRPFATGVDLDALRDGRGLTPPVAQDQPSKEA